MFYIHVSFDILSIRVFQRSEVQAYSQRAQGRDSVQLQPLSGLVLKWKSICLLASLQRVILICPNTHPQHTFQKLLQIPPLELHPFNLTFRILMKCFPSKGQPFNRLIVTYTLMQMKHLSPGSFRKSGGRVLRRKKVLNWAKDTLSHFKSGEVLLLHQRYSDDGQVTEVWILELPLTSLGKLLNRRVPQFPKL